MNDLPRLPRNPELMSRGDTGLVVVDVQEKLIRLIPAHERVVWNVRRLIDGAIALGLPVVATEQYPQGLGGTTAELAARLRHRPGKLAFSCGECGALFHDLEQRGVRKLLLAGIETHVCVQQTAFDLLAAGFGVYLAVDATGSRHDIDSATALRRLDSAGAALTTTEAALFEWCETAAAPEFKEISRLVKESPPA